MNWEAYWGYFNEILEREDQVAPYDNPDYLDYTKLNASRQKRWEKRGIILDELKEKLSSLKEPQHWTLITEPWCGDASHISPFIYLLSQLSDKISLDIVLRDDGNDMINQYLTNGGKAIPILVVRDADNNDLFHWGPRPAEAQTLYWDLKNDPSKTWDAQKVPLQQWYNSNKGVHIQEELLAKFNKL